MAKIYGNTTTTPIKPDLFGGEAITVDQTYNPESANAQSGVAVAEATKDFVHKKTFDGLVDDVNKKQAKPTLITSGTNILLEDNSEYRLTNVTKLDISYPNSNFECWLRLSFATEGTITVQLPESQYIGAAPTFANGDTWEISIKDGVVIAQKIGA